MTGWDHPAMAMDPPNQFLLTQTLLVGITGFVNTDGVRSGAVRFFIVEMGCHAYYRI